MKNLNKCMIWQTGNQRTPISTHSQELKRNFHINFSCLTARKILQNKLLYSSQRLAYTMLIKQFAKYSRQINKMWQSFLPKQPLLFHWSVPSSQAVRLQLYSVKREFCSTVTGMHAEPNITVCSTHRFHWCCRNLGRNHVGSLRYICVGVSNCFWWRKRFFFKKQPCTAIKRSPVLGTLAMKDTSITYKSEGEIHRISPTFLPSNIMQALNQTLAG